MANRDYTTPHVPHEWSDSRETHPAVAMAIHAISDKYRSPESIWEAPTPAEWEAVTMAVDEYLTHEDFDRDPKDRYAWGCAAIIVPGVQP